MFRILFIVLFLLLIGLASCSVDSLEAPVDLETAKELAMEAAKKHSGVDFDPHYASQAGFDSPHAPKEHFLHEDFQDYHFVYVWGQMAHTCNAPFAISRDGLVFKLPEEFNRLTEDREIVLECEDEARALLEFYLVFDVVLPGTDRHVILKKLYDIPGIESEQGLTEKYHDVVRPITVELNKTGWMFDFFTWRSVGGFLFRWNAQVSRIGQIDIEKKEKIDELVGDYLVIE